jgi:hypothetical protein
MSNNNVHLTHAELNLLRQAVDCLMVHQYDLLATGSATEQANLTRKLNDLLDLKDRRVSYSFSNLP